MIRSSQDFDLRFFTHTLGGLIDFDDNDEHSEIRN